MKKYKAIFSLLSFIGISLIFLSPSFALSFADPRANSGSFFQTAIDLEQLVADYSFKVVFWGSIILTLLAAISLKLKKTSPFTKKILFGSMVLTIIAPTLFLAVSTIYLNTISSSGGPVHWHADLEIWNCGSEIDIIDPKGWSNKVGTSTLHEHNDKRVHLEGVVVDPHDASLGKFFNVIGGNLMSNSLTIQTTSGLLTLRSGSACPSGEQASLQVFLYKTHVNGTFYQQKLERPSDYIISPFSQVPPGDCIIVEFGVPREKTDRLCRSYKVAKEIGKLKGETSYGN